MRISTKGRYALRVVVDMARNGGENYVKLQDLSARQQISEKYLEGILGSLVRARILEGYRGKGGGYRLRCKLSECSVWDILKLTETSVAPVACLDDDENRCERASACVTLPIWKELNSLIRGYLESVKLDQFVRNMPENEGVIPGGDSWNCGL
ncbi:MAG: Rrf2 family transcriptional regulator [Fibrobacter sp.]|nr:Rrf2 family transcriptional regulator [Fibrobacter sp.]